jgi:hypothetical protein
MNRLAVVLCSCSLICSFVSAEDTFVNTTFQEILSRVKTREKTTGAVLYVLPKDDAPPFPTGLDFRIEELAFQDEAIVTLSKPQKTGDDTFEQYRLRMDDAMRAELKKLKEWERQRPQGK